jgi:hypothetical protein
MEDRTIVFCDQSGFTCCPWWFVLTLRWEKHPSSMSISAAITS